MPLVYFQHVWGLFGLLLIPVFWTLFLMAERRRWMAAFELSAIGSKRYLQQYSSRFQRFLYPVSITLLISSLSLGLAQPTTTTWVSKHSVDVMLVLDISLSMLAKDVSPSRLQAAQRYASDFVNSLPDTVRVGLTLFAGNSYVVSGPSTDHAKIARYLSALKPDDLRPRTEIGTAIQSARQAFVFENDESLHQSKNVSPGKGRVILLMSDGDSREGYPWDLAAREAHQAGIQIHTIAIGQPTPTIITYQGEVLPVSFSADTLREVAQLGGGQFYQAFHASDFSAIYQHVRQKALHIERSQKDLTPWCCAMALLILLVYLGLSLRPFFKNA